MMPAAVFTQTLFQTLFLAPIVLMAFTFSCLSIGQARRAQRDERLRWLIPFAAGFGLFLVNQLLNFIDYFEGSYQHNYSVLSLLAPLIRLSSVIAWILLAYSALAQWRGLKASDAATPILEAPLQADATTQADTWPPAPTTAFKP